MVSGREETTYHSLNSRTDTENITLSGFRDGSPGQNHHTSNDSDFATYKPHPRDVRLSSNSSFLGDWWLDVLGVICSALAFIAIIAILYHFENQPQPGWKVISLNTVISFLSQFAKFCILAPISTAIGQLKWIWFSERERQVSELEAFDAASRGFAGGLGLIWVQRARYETH